MPDSPALPENSAVAPRPTAPLQLEICWICNFPVFYILCLIPKYSSIPSPRWQRDFTSGSERLTVYSFMYPCPPA